MSYRLVVALILLSGTGSAVAATMYRWVDAQGVVHYSDQPQPGAEKVQMGTVQTYKPSPAPSPVKAEQGADQGSASKTSSYHSCRITGPTAEQSFYAPESVPVTIELEPALQPGDELLVAVDGVPLSSPAADALEFQVPEPTRGSHTVSATVRTADGKTACTAPVVTFNVQRPSLLSPQSPARGN